MLAAKTPKVSVVMPVHNALPYLDAAVESVLAQTYEAFEFLILDDASSDGSTERLREWALRDSRIRLLQSPIQLGPALSSQKVAKAASAPIVARMDADDISHPDRLREGISVFESHPDAGVVACLCDFIDVKGRMLRSSERWRLARRSPFVPFAHGAMMYRRDVFDKVGGYRRECEYWEDLDFVLRASRQTRILVFPRPLYRYRQSQVGTRLASDQKRVEAALDLRYRSIDRVRQKRTYDDLLLAGPVSDDERVDPRVFLSLGLLAVWSGGRKGLFGRLFQRSRVRFDRTSAMAAASVLWTTVSPGTP